MSRPVRESNVFYIAPQPAPEPVVQAPGVATRLRKRFARAAWRLRLLVADIRLAIRRPGSQLFAEDDYPPLLEAPREVDPPPAAESRRRRPAGPARVLDFESARTRRRPVTA